MTRRPIRTSLILVLSLLWLPQAATAQWASLGEMPAPRREGNTLTFRNRQAVVAVTAIAPEIIRVRLVPGGSLGRDHSYAVVARDFGDPGAAFATRGGETTITTRALRVGIRHRPFRIAIADGSGASLFEEDPAMGTAISGAASRVYTRLRPDEQVYGLGEKNGKLNRRGKMQGGYSYTMWNSDTYAYDASIDPLYASFPFYIVLRGGRAHGVFLDNTHRSNFDIGHQFHGVLSFGADGGELDYYFIDGPDPKAVIERYTHLTGRMPLPPMWALGLHQSRYSYYPASRVRFIANNFRERRIPADVLWLDIHYLDGFNPFTWDRERFPDPPGMIKELGAQGFRVVPIVDAHPKKQPGWAVYDSGLKGDHYVKNPDGTVLEAPVWPSNATTSPGPSVFPDFSKPAAREWWGSLYQPLVDDGVAGIWNDMNEPALFVPPTGTMPLDARHHGEGQPTDHREIHNVYGLLMTRSTFEGLARLRPNERPFVLTRATFAGGQRYAALWPGDNVSTWTALQSSIPMLESLGLSGMPFVGTDIGGFADVPTAELFTRWLQMGVFHPFMRIHTTFGTDDQEPWSYGVAHEIVNREAIELRYRMLPHVYNVMREASETGIPALRPAFLEFPSDPQTWDQDDQIMFGADLLVAPVLRPGERTRGVYLPKGTDWYDFWTGKRHAGGQGISMPVTLGSIPVFARAGAMVFQQPVVQHTGQMQGQPLVVMVFPASKSEATLYEDDGRTLDYTKGNYSLRRFTQVRTADPRGSDLSVSIDIAAPKGAYRPAPRAMILVVQWSGEPRAVSLRSGEGAPAPLPRVDVTELERQPTGWTITDDGRVRVKFADSFGAASITIER